MKAAASVVVEPGVAGSRVPRLTELRSSSPLTLRWAGGALYIVGSAFAPLGGDELRLDVRVAPGASLTVRTVAAAVAQRGRGGKRSHFLVDADVAAGATLRWLPEPGVAADGCRHVNETRLRVAEDARVEWWEEILLGRHREAGGEWCSAIHAERDGAPLLAQETVVGGPGWRSPAIGGGARATGSVLLLGPDAPASPETWTGGPEGSTGHGRAAVMPLAAPNAAVATALAPDARTLRWLLSHCSPAEADART